MPKSFFIETADVSVSELVTIIVQKDYFKMKPIFQQLLEFLYINVLY